MLNPTIDDSANGESITRPLYFLLSPSVARNTPPASTSSPNRNTRSSSAMASSRAVRTASMTVACAISQLLVDEAEGVFGLRVGLHERPLRGLANLFLHAALYLIEVFAREDPVRLHAGTEEQQRVLPGPLFELFFRPVAGIIVVAGVRPEAIALRLDEIRATAVAGLIDRRLHRLVDRNPVHPIANHALDVVAALSIGDVRHRHELFRPLRDRIPVVFDEKDDRKLVDGREVQRLMKVAPAGAALATASHHNNRVLVHLRRQGDARGVQELRRDDRTLGDDLPFAVRPVSRHLAAVAVRVIALGEQVEHRLTRRLAEDKVHSE